MGALLQLTERTELERVVEAGDISHDSRGRYSLARTAAGLRIANQLTGVLSHTSAAMHWGWPVKTTPELPHVVFPRKRRLDKLQRKLVLPHWYDLTPSDIHDGHVTTKAQTLVDCLRSLPFDEALVVADSALRQEDVTPTGLATLAAGVRGNGARQARRVAALADARSANPFESVLRAIALDIPGLELTPQGVVSGPGFWGRHDLVDFRRCLVLEADSHEFHKTRAQVLKDCRRYNALIIHGWIVLRFAWEDVMFEQAHVRDHLLGVLDWELRRTGRLARSGPGPAR